MTQVFFPIKFAVGAILQPLETVVVKLCCAKTRRCESFCVLRSL